MKPGHRDQDSFALRQEMLRQPVHLHHIKQKTGFVVSGGGICLSLLTGKGPFYFLLKDNVWRRSLRERYIPTTVEDGFPLSTLASTKRSNAPFLHNPLDFRVVLRSPLGAFLCRVTKKILLKERVDPGYIPTTSVEDRFPLFILASTKRSGFAFPSQSSGLRVVLRLYPSKPSRYPYSIQENPQKRRGEVWRSFSYIPKTFVDDRFSLFTNDLISKQAGRFLWGGSWRHQSCVVRFFFFFGQPGLL